MTIQHSQFTRCDGNAISLNNYARDVAFIGTCGLRKISCRVHIYTGVKPYVLTHRVRAYMFCVIVCVRRE